jgi:hypothetical protein
MCRRGGAGGRHTWESFSSLHSRSAMTVAVRFWFVTSATSPKKVLDLHAPPVPPPVSAPAAPHAIICCCGWARLRWSSHPSSETRLPLIQTPARP